jgi:hypothetical protein
MSRSDQLHRGRGAYAGQQWGEAFAQLMASDHEAPLEIGDLERLAVAAHLVGRDDESARSGPAPTTSVSALAMQREPLGAPSGWRSAC